MSKLSIYRHINNKLIIQLTDSNNGSINSLTLNNKFIDLLIEFIKIMRETGNIDHIESEIIKND